MKFRCTKDSVRLRVRKSDLEVLKSEGQVSDHVHFGPDDQLSFVLALSQSAAMHASFKNGTVRVELPEAQARAWMESEEVGMEAFQPADGQGLQLHVLVEKDFPCRHTTEANREDTFFELAPEDPTVC